MPSKIIVTGCGRTGTQFLASVLRKCGLRTGHEHIYSLDTATETPWQKWEKQDVEVSWFAAPLLPWATVDHVWHILRDPIKVYRCWTEHKLLKPDGSHLPESPVTAFVHRALPECSQGTNEERVIKYILGWNVLIEREGRKFPGYRRFCIEKLTPEYLQHLLADASVRIPLEMIMQAMADVSANLGSCRHTSDLPTWESIEKHPGGYLLHEKALEWGYRE